MLIPVGHVRKITLIDPKLVHNWPWSIHYSSPQSAVLCLETYTALNVDPGPSFWAAVETADGKYAQKLFNDLFEDYSNALRPVEDTDKVLNVTLQITLSQIKDMVSNI